jgi:hypothetical protein
MVEVVEKLGAKAVDRDARGIPGACEVRSLRERMQKNAGRQHTIADS